MNQPDISISICRTKDVDQLEENVEDFGDGLPEERERWHGRVLV